MSWNTNADKKKAGETRTFLVSFADKLRSGEVLIGTPTAEEYGTSALTITDVDLNSEDWTISGRTIKSATAVQLTISGGSARSDYTIRVRAESDTGQTLIYDVRLKVE